MDYCIRKLLRLTEENFITDENWLEIVTDNNEIVFSKEDGVSRLFLRNKTKTPILKDWSSKFKETNCLFVTPTHDVYLDNGTRTRLTVGEWIIACNYEKYKYLYD